MNANAIQALLKESRVVVTHSDDGYQGRDAVSTLIHTGLDQRHDDLPLTELTRSRRPKGDLNFSRELWNHITDKGYHFLAQIGYA